MTTDVATLDNRSLLRLYRRAKRDGISQREVLHGELLMRSWYGLCILSKDNKPTLRYRHVMDALDRLNEVDVKTLMILLGVQQRVSRIVMKATEDLIANKDIRA